MAELNNDPRTQGVSGIKGLKGLTRDEIREELLKSVPTLKDEWGNSSKRFGKTSFENIVENYGYRGILEYNRAAQDNSFDSEYIAPEDFGHSTYDKEASTLADVEDLEDLRGRNQSGLLQLTNGAIKFGGTAASSFVDGTVGVLWGLGAAVAEWDLSAFYNNAYAEASKDFRDGMEKWFPNYRETEERENYEKGEWYKNILTANFFGDHVMKTAGYTVGAVAAGSAAVKALSLAGRFVNPTVARVTATTLSSSSESALMANEAFNDNLKEGSKLLNTAASQELNNLTEGYLSIRSSLEAELKGLDDMDKADELAAALGEDKDAGAFKKVRDERRGEILKALKELEKDYTERANNLKEQQAITEAEVYSRAKDAGDKVFLANMALLGVSEYFSVGRLYERLAKGKISSDAKSLIDIVQHRATVDKEIAKRAIKQAAYEPIQEGLIEEGGQSMIDETVKAAYLTDDVEAYRDALRNKESLKKGLDVIDAFGKGFSESYGNPAVWEEIALGGLMGITGTVSVGKSNNSTNDTWFGKDKFIGMKGGAIGEIMAARRGLKEAETIAADVNKQLQNYVDPDGTIKRDIGVQAHFRDATEGWDRDTHKFGTLNKQANADFALVQTLYDIGQAKYLETLIDGVDIDQMTDKQLEETAKLLKITDSTGNNLKSDTKEGREEIKELLKRDRDDVKQAIKNFNTAYNVTEHLTRGISIDDDTKRELAYLNFKVLNFQDRSEAIREKYSKELLDLNSKLLDRYSNRVKEAHKDVVENKDLKNKKINNELELNSIISNMKNVQGNIRRLLQQQSKGVKKRQRIKNAKKNAAELEAYEKAKSILLEREKEIKSTIEEIESKGIKDLKTLEDTLNKLISLYSEVTRNYNYIYNLEGADSKKSKILTPEAISKVIDKFEDYIESIYTEGGLYEEGNKKSAKEFTKAVIDLSALNVAGNQFKERIQDFLEEDKRTKIEEKRREKEEKQRIKDFLKEMDKKDVSEITEDEIKELEKINNRKSKSILKKIESYNKKKAKQQAVQNKIDEDIKNSAQKEEDTTENTEGEEVEDAAKADMIKFIEEFLKKDFTGVVIGDVLLEASLASMFATHLGDSRVKRIADKLKSLTPYLYDRFKKVVGESTDIIEMLNAQSSHIEEEAVEQLQKYASILSREDYQNAKEGVVTQLESYFKDYIEDLNKVGEEVEEEIENLPDNSESEEGEDSDDSDDATPPVEPNEEPTDSSEDNPSIDENTEGEGNNDNPDTNLPSSNEDSESENTPPVNVNHVGPNQFPGWKPDVTEFWTHADEKGEYLPSDKAIEGKIKRTNKEGKEYNLDYTKRQKIIFKTIYEFLKKKGAFEVVDKAIDSGEKLRFTVHYELVEEINKELKNNNEEELETYPIVIENADGMVLNVCGLDYTINNEGGINVTQTDIDAIKKEITEEAKKYKEENPEEEYYVSNFESEIASMMYGIYVPVNPKLSSLSKEEIKDLKVGVLQKINEDGSYTLLVGDSSITVSPSSNYINTLGTPFVVKEIKPGKYKAVQLFLNNDTKTKIAEIANEMFKNGADLEAIKTFLGDIFDPIIYEVSTSSKSIIIKDATFSLKTQALSAVIPKELLVTSSLKELEGRNIGNILASFGEVNDINFSSKNTWFTFNIPYKKQNTKASTTTPEKVAGVNNTVASLFAEAEDISTSNEEVKDTFTNTEEENNSVSDTDNTEVTNNNNDANTFIDEYSLGWLKEKNPDLFNNVNFKAVREVIGVFYFPEDMEENDWVNLLNNNKTNSEKYRTKEKEGYEKINIEKELAWFRKKFPNLSEDRIIKHVDNLIKIKGNRVAYGMYKRGIITLSKLAATGTLYHESFHFVFDLFISNKEKEDIYKEAREKFNLKTQSDIEVEEQLAEAFRRYVQLEETPILGSLIHIFRELKHFIQNFIGNEPYINKLFYKINNAKIDTSEVQPSSSGARHNEIDLSFDREGFHGSFLDDLEFIGEGSESTIYRKGNKVIKISEPYYSDQFESRINNTLLIDSINNLNTKLIGFYYSQDSKGNKFKNPIFEQDFVEGKEATEEQIDEELKSRGFTKDTSDYIAKFVDNKTGVTISDVYSGNAFISNGKVVFVDADITGASTNNIGTYDESNDDIRYREVEESDKSFESIKFLAKKDLDGILKQNAEKFWNTELLGNKKLSALVNNAKTIEDLEKVYKEIVENIKNKLLGSSVFISNNRARNEVAAAQNTYPREMRDIVRNLGIMYQEDASLYTDEELQAIVGPTAELLTKERQKVSKKWIEAIKSLDPSEQFLVLHSITRYVTRENKEAIPIMYMKDAYENTIKKYKESKNPTSFNFYTEYNKSILEKITDPSSNEVISVSAEEGGGISGTWVKFNRGSVGNAEITKNKLAAASIGTNWCTQHAEQGGRRVIEEDDHDFYAFIPSGFTHATMAIVPIKENENELVLESNPWYTGIFKLSNGAENEIDPQYKKAVETLQKKSKDAELQRTLSFLKIGTSAPSLEEIANRIENETLTQDDIVVINSSFNLGFSVINSNPLELTIDILDIKRFLMQGERLNMNRLTLLKFLDKYLCEVERFLDISELTTEVNLSTLKSIGTLHMPYLSGSSLYLNLPNLTHITYLYTSQRCTINAKELSTIVSVEATDSFKINSDSNLYIEQCYFSPRSKNSFIRVPMNTRVEKLFLDADAEGDITIEGITKAKQIQISDMSGPKDHEIIHSNHLIFNDLTDVHRLNIHYSPDSLARLNAKKLTNIDYIKSSGIVFNLPSVLSIKNVLWEFSGYTPSLMNINFSYLSITGDIMLSGYVEDTKLQNYKRKYPKANIIKADKFESAYTEEEAKVFTEVGVGDFKNRAILLQLKEAISKAGISVEIISESEIEDILIDDEVELSFFKLPDGAIYGFVKEGVIYLVKDKMNPETLIHEYTHLWVNTLKQVNPKLWENIKSLLFQTLKSEKDESVLQYAKGRQIAVMGTTLHTMDTTLDPYEEMLAYYSGIYNERTIKEKTASDSTYGDISKSFNSLKEALGKFWNWLKEFLTLNSNLNNITDVTNLILSDLLQGRKHVRSDKSSGFLSKIESEKRSRQLSTDNTKKSIAQDVRNREGEKNLDINKQAVTEEESIEERIKIYEYRYSRLEYDNLSPTDIEYLKSIGMPKKAFNLLPVAVRENLLLCK